MGAIRELGLLDYLAPNDDDAVRVDLPFTVTINNETFNFLYLSNNGVIEFTHATNTNYGDLGRIAYRWWPTTGEIVSDAVVSDHVIAGSPLSYTVAGFWTDIDTRSYGSVDDGGSLQYGPCTVDGYESWAAWWKNVSYYGRTNPAPRLDLQIIVLKVGDATYAEINVDRAEFEAGTANNGIANTGLWDLSHTPDWETWPIVEYGAPAAAGWWLGPDISWQKPGSFVPRALIDSNTSTGMIHNSKNSDVLGRYRTATTRVGVLKIKVQGDATDGLPEKWKRVRRNT